MDEDKKIKEAAGFRLLRIKKMKHACKETWTRSFDWIQSFIHIFVNSLESTDLEADFLDWHSSFSTY
jgi:hypothetical protein